jgi:hypothetical protein
MTYALRHTLGEVEAASSGPFFIPDIYEKDLGPAPNFAALAAQPRVVGCILKATEGTYYAPPWFTANWNRVRVAGGSRYGSSWFRGCYHFGRPEYPGALQADFLLAAVERAGGFGDGDMPPAWDIEGSSWKSKQQVVDISSAFAARIKQRIGKTPLLYAGSLIRDMGITNHMGFSQLWSPQISMQAAAWPVSQYALWQYAGDGGRPPHGYDLRANYPASGALAFPMSIPGWGGTDMNVVMDGGMPATSIESVKKILTGRGGILFPLLLGVGLLAVGIALARRSAGERAI